MWPFKKKSVRKQEVVLTLKMSNTEFFDMLESHHEDIINNCEYNFIRFTMPKVGEEGPFVVRLVSEYIDSSAQGCEMNEQEVLEQFWWDTKDMPEQQKGDSE